MDRGGALGLSQRLEAAHVAFALPRGLMGHLSPTVGIRRGTVTDRGEGGPRRSPIAAQFISDQPIENVAQPLQALAKEPCGRTCSPALLHQNIKRVSILIYCPPQVRALASDADEQFIQMPGVAWLSPSSA